MQANANLWWLISFRLATLAFTLSLYHYSYSYYSYTTVRTLPIGTAGGTLEASLLW